MNAQIRERVDAFEIKRIEGNSCLRRVNRIRNKKIKNMLDGGCEWYKQSGIGCTN